VHAAAAQWHASDVFPPLGRLLNSVMRQWNRAIVQLIWAGYLLIRVGSRVRQTSIGPVIESGQFSSFLPMSYFSSTGCNCGLHTAAAKKLCYRPRRRFRFRCRTISGLNLTNLSTACSPHSAKKLCYRARSVCLPMATQGRSKVDSGAASKILTLTDGR
jgi:hypothetical protein